MNIDFRLSVGLFQHPKFVKLRRRLGTDAGLAYITLLAFTAQNHPDGDLGNMDADDIAIAGQYDGDPEAFITALTAFRLLDATEDGRYVIHDWKEHNPWAAAAPARSEKAKKAAEARWGTTEQSSQDSTEYEKQSSLCSEHTTSISQASVSNAPILTKPIPSTTNTESEHKPEEIAGEPMPSPEERPPRAKARYCARASRWEWLKKVPEPQVPLADWYEYEYYANHPVRKNPEEGWKAVVKLNPSEDLRTQILSQQAEFKAVDRQWLGGFVPYPATWINDRGWEGEPSEEKVNDRRRTQSVAGGAAGGNPAGAGSSGTVPRRTGSAFAQASEIASGAVKPPGSVRLP